MMIVQALLPTTLEARSNQHGFDALITQHPVGLYPSSPYLRFSVLWNTMELLMWLTPWGCFNRCWKASSEWFLDVDICVQGPRSKRDSNTQTMQCESLVIVGLPEAHRPSLCYSPYYQNEYDCSAGAVCCQASYPHSSITPPTHQPIMYTNWPVLHHFYPSSPHFRFNVLWYTMKLLMRLTPFLGLLCQSKHVWAKKESTTCPFSVLQHRIRKQPGVSFNLTIDLPFRKAISCYRTPESCQFILQAEDGVTVLSSASDLTLVSETRNAEWKHTYTFALSKSLRNQVMKGGKKSSKGEKDHQFIIQMTTDLCNPPAAANLMLTLVRKGGAKQKSCKESIKVRKERMMLHSVRPSHFSFLSFYFTHQVAIEGGFTGKVDYTNNQACALLGCQRCDSISSTCLQCYPSWRKNTEGQCGKYQTLSMG